MKWDITHLKWKGFDANPQNINRNWRPRKQFSIIISEIKELWYESPSNSEIAEMCWLLIALTRSELEEVAKRDTFPIIMRIIANRLLSDRAFETVEKILDRIYWKTIQKHIENDRVISVIIN